MALRILTRTGAKRVWVIVALAILLVAVMACDPGHGFTIINQTDQDATYVWNRGQGITLKPLEERRPSLLYISGDRGNPENHLFQAFDLDGNLICVSNRTEQEWEDRNWTIYIKEAEECGAPP